MKINRVIIRKAIKADLDFIVDLWVELLDYHNRLDGRFWIAAPDGRRKFRTWIRKSISHKKRVLFVAKVSGRIVGFTHGMLKGNPSPLKPQLGGFITDLVVAESYRRSGIGKRLLKAIEKWFILKKATRITLTTAVRNNKGIKFWKELGFEPHTYTMLKSLK